MRKVADNCFLLVAAYSSVSCWVGASASLNFFSPSSIPCPPCCGRGVLTFIQPMLAAVFRASRRRGVLLSLAYPAYLPTLSAPQDRWWRGAAEAGPGANGRGFLIALFRSTARAYTVNLERGEEMFLPFALQNSTESSSSAGWKEAGFPFLRTPPFPHPILWRRSQNFPWFGASKIRKNPPKKGGKASLLYYRKNNYDNLSQ